MPVDGVAVVVGPSIEIRVDLRTGDLTAKASNSRDRTLLAGLGPLRSAARCDREAVLLETESGERWLVRMSPVSGLVAAIDPAVGGPAAPGEGEPCTTRM